jgi:hypothetical protein
MVYAKRALILDEIGTFSLTFTSFTVSLSSASLSQRPREIVIQHSRELIITVQPTNRQLNLEPKAYWKKLGVLLVRVV